MNNIIIKTATAGFILASVAGVSVAPAATNSGDGSSQTAREVKTDGTSSGDSEFEKTRQHMIEMNKQSQRTGKM